VSKFWREVGMAVEDEDKNAAAVQEKRRRVPRPGFKDLATFGDKLFAAGSNVSECERSHKKLKMHLTKQRTKLHEDTLLVLTRLSAKFHSEDLASGRTQHTPESVMDTVARKVRHRIHHTLAKQCQKKAADIVQLLEQTHTDESLRGLVRPEAIEEALKIAGADPFFARMMMEEHDINGEYYVRMYDDLQRDDEDRSGSEQEDA
jgi:predicted peroxiredoxin